MTTSYHRSSSKNERQTEKNETAIVSDISEKAAKNTAIDDGNTLSSIAKRCSDTLQVYSDYLIRY